MNQQLHRLVFSRRHGMLMAVAETARCGGKTASGEGPGAGARRTVRAGASMLWAGAAALAVVVPTAWAQTRPPVVFAGKLAAPASKLPVPYGTTRLPNGAVFNATPRAFVYDPATGISSADLAASGRVVWRVDGSTATFDQGSVERVVINWDSFNIGSGYKVHFAQDKDPAKYVAALNRIWSADPSLILGSLTADREVILLNANGVYFGRGARVDTGKFVATSLSIADNVFDKGLRNITDGSAVFGSTGTGYLPTNLDSGVTVEAGAEIRSAAGGDVLLFAPRVVNQGRIETPHGQTVLAAGDKVYLMSSSDPKQRGLIVAVDPVKVAGTNTNDAELGIVENAAGGSYKTVNGVTVSDNMPDATAGLVNRINEIRAESGTVNLVGLTVRQQGTINATTAVKGANGAIYLQAMASTKTLLGGTESSAPASLRGLRVETGAVARVGLDLGVVQIGANSVTAVRPDTGPQTQIDAEVFNRPLMRVEGASILVEGGARMEAASGRIELLAAASTFQRPAFDSSVTEVPSAADGSRIFIGPGATISTAGLHNVAVDGARNQGSQRLFRIELADAPVQKTGPLYRNQVFFDLRNADKITAADVSGAANTVGRTAQERSTVGGSIRIESEGDLAIAPQSVLDVSGGSLSYSGATLKNTLLNQNGRSILFGTASAGVRIDSVLAATQMTAAPAYDEGKDGGSLVLNARRAVLAGELRGQLVEGAYQRDGRAVRAAPASLDVGRQLGSRFYLDGVELNAGMMAGVDAALIADPLNARWAELPAKTELPLPMLQQGGFGKVAVRAAKLSQGGSASLDLGAGGALLISAGAVDLNASFKAAGGSLSVASLITTDASGALTSGDIHLSSGTRIDASGLWTNDSAASPDVRRSSVKTDGGSVTVRAARSLLADPGAALDVSAGAWLSASGALTRGKAGNLSLGGGAALPGSSDFFLAIDGVALAGFDFAKGGSLTLDAPTLTITDGPAQGFALVPGFFSGGGFGNIAVNSGGNVLLPSGTLLAPRLRNWQLDAGFRRAGSGTLAHGPATAQPIDEQLAERNPVNLALTARADLSRGGGNVTVERGAGIALEHAGSLTLRATGSVLIGTTGGADADITPLSARGGNILLALDGLRGGPQGPTDDPIGFLAAQAIWLGAGADLSVAGIATLRPAPANTSVFFHPGSTSAEPAAERMAGSVLGGGNITLQAARGYVVAQAGSNMRLDGLAQAVSLPGVASAVTLARAAGTLAVSSPEGFVLEGNISAQAPRNSQGLALADGGRLNLAVARGGAFSATQGTAYPDSVANKPRTIAVGNFAHLLGAAEPGANLAVLLDNGIGYTPVALLANAGFDAVKLSAGDQLRFDTSVQFNKPLGIEVESPLIAGRAGVRVDLAASHIAIGDLSSRASSGHTTAVADASSDRSTTLRLSAPEIDIYNQSGFSGFSRVELDAGGRRDGEVRLTSARDTSSQTGQLNFAGELRITAGQTYATSGTRFGISGLAAQSPQDRDSTLILRTPPGGSSSTTPLSAFGALSMAAPRIDQGGVLRQPFGQISLVATQQLILGQDSITSVSGDGFMVPYGSTENLSRWIVDGFNTAGLPIGKTVTLSAPDIQASASASVSARGGGDILAWEFFPGVGGSRDYYNSAGLFAVLPDYASTRALSYGGGVPSDASGGQQIVITMGGAGLPAGRYTLLPARYALLGATLPHGAFLVSRSSDQGKTVLQAPMQRDDGSVVVTGYLSQTGSVTAGTPGERFVIEPQATFAARSEVRATAISTLLDGRAQTLGSAQAPALPRDAGRVELDMTGSTTAAFAARIDLNAGGGRAGLLDITSSRLALVDTLDKTPNGALGILASSIGESGAGSVLLGGKRQAVAASVSGATGETWAIDASGTQSVNVDIGTARLNVEELLLASTGSITLADNTHIAGTSSGTLGARTLQTSGDGAFVAVGANALKVLRSGDNLAQGSLILGRGVELSGPQLALDATRRITVDPSVRLSGQSLALAAPRLVLGESATADPIATVLSAALLDKVREFDELNLRSYTGIDFAGLQNWTGRTPATSSEPARVLQRLVLDTPQLLSVAGRDAAGSATGGFTDIAAHTLTIQNSSGRAADSTRVGDGVLQFEARPGVALGAPTGLIVGPGTVALGASESRLASTGDIVLQGSGGLAASSKLTLSSARLSATSAADQSISANAGTLTISSAAGGLPGAGRIGQGASVRLSALQVLQQGHIDLASGRLQINASGRAGDATAVRFDAGSVTDLSGAVRTGSDGTQAHAKGGDIAVQAVSGRIEVLGAVDVSAARLADGTRAGDAGAIRLQATGAGGAVAFNAGGGLRGVTGAGADDLGGSLSVDMAQAASLNLVAQQASAGGFTRQLTARVRQGDVALASDVTASRIQLSADGGQLSLASTLDARAATGGVVQLAASGDLLLQAGTRIDARSSRPGAGGGDVLLSSSAGRLRLAADALVDTRGDDAQDGRIVLRAQRAANNTSVAIDALDTRHLLGGEVDIEALRTYRTVTIGAVTRDITAIATGTSAVMGSGATSTGRLGQTTVASDNSAFMAAAAGVRGALGIGAAESGRVNLRAGVEVIASGDLTVSNDWLLNTTANRPGGDAGFLTLRAAGNLAINGSISDGFSTATVAGVLNNNAHSWNYRLVAGADTGAADPLASRALAAGATETGNLTIAAGKLVRTGAGSIAMAAGRDIVFVQGSGTTASGQTYVAGRGLANQATLNSTLFARQTAKPTFSEAGGRLELTAGRDIRSPEATQLVNNWFWRSGLASVLASEPDFYSATSQLAWWTQFSRFNQTVGSFGGGDLRVTAGRDVVNLQAMVPSAAWSDSRSRSAGQLTVLDGGDLLVQAGRDVVAGQYFVGRGNGRIDAGRDMAQADANTVLHAPIFATMDGSWNIQARGAVVSHGVFNPTLVAAPRADNRFNTSGVFATLGDASGFSVTSAAGNVAFEGFDAATSLYGVDNSAGAPLYQVTTPRLSVSALSGDIRFFGTTAGAAVLFPSAKGGLSLWADGDVQLSGSVAMADTALSAWPDLRNPAAAPTGAAGLRTPDLVGQILDNKAPKTGLRAADAAPVTVHAGGSIQTLGLATLQLAKAGHLFAGADIDNLRLVGQNLNATDVTSVTAGHNFSAGQQGFVSIGGPGLVQVVAGRQVDLDASAGIVTTGNQGNASLPAQGASVVLRAAASGRLDVATFDASYLQPASQGGSDRWQQHRDTLLASVRLSLQQPGLSYQDAWNYFKAFPAETQAAVGRQVLAQEFGAVYLATSVPTRAGMTESLRLAFEREKAQLLQAGASALAAGKALTLPGREVLQGAALASYLGDIRALAFTSLDLSSIVAARVANLTAVQNGWRDAVATRLGGSAAAFDAVAAQNPQSLAAQAWRNALSDYGGPRFEAYRDQILASETASAGAAASLFGRKSLPMRLALFDQGFQAAELAGAGSFVEQAVWQGARPVFSFTGSMDMTQSSVVTQRGGDISLVNAGGAINVGLKQGDSSDTSSAKGVIALGGGNIFGYAKSDFQVNTQRVFIVGTGDMNIWSSSGDIDSGRGANTAVAAPPLTARRSVDGVVFEVPATTTGSGLGILEDGAGVRSGTIGLYPAFGEILALDAFIRAPSVVLGSSIKGADNLQAASVGGAAAPVTAPVLAVAPASSNAKRSAETQSATQPQETRARNSLLTVDLLGLGPADDECSEQDRANNKCPVPTK